ncbi:MAG: Rnf-Nqr domain containing protein [Gemmiger sp.]|nr:Rnf-Nqr domain containing protein [Gemmiger sp.]
MQNGSNKNKPRRATPEQSQTVIIPKITPEMMAQARRDAVQHTSNTAGNTAGNTTGTFGGTGGGNTGDTTIQQAKRPAAGEKPAEKAPEQPPKPRQPEKEKPSSQAQAQAELWRWIHDNHLWLNNPVIMRGLGLAPVVVAAVSAQSALMLCVAALLLLTPTRVLAVAVCHLTGNRFRPVTYCYAAALLYIPAYIVLYRLFGVDLAALGIYLPILVVEPVIIKRMEADTLETVGEAFRRGLNNTAGLCLAVFLVGCLRELLAAGTVFGARILNAAPLPLASEPAGGFILLGVVAAFWTAIANSYVHYKQQEVKRNYAERR